MSASNEPRELRQRTVSSLYGAIGVDSRAEYDVMLAVLAEVARQDATPHNVAKLTRDATYQRAIFKAALAIREALRLKAEGGAA